MKKSLVLFYCLMLLIPFVSSAQKKGGNSTIDLSGYYEGTLTENGKFKNMNMVIQLIHKSKKVQVKGWLEKEYEFEVSTEKKDTIRAFINDSNCVVSLIYLTEKNRLTLRKKCGNVSTVFMGKFSTKDSADFVETSAIATKKVEKPTDTTFVGKYVSQVKKGSKGQFVTDTISVYTYMHQEQTGTLIMMNNIISFRSQKNLFPNLNAQYKLVPEKKLITNSNKEVSVFTINQATNDLKFYNKDIPLTIEGQKL